jgi:hypothetical protein
MSNDIFPPHRWIGRTFELASVLILGKATGTYHAARGLVVGDRWDSVRLLAATTIATAATLLISATTAASKPEKEVVPFSSSIENFVECPTRDSTSASDFFGSQTFKTWRDESATSPPLDHGHEPPSSIRTTLLKPRRLQSDQHQGGLRAAPSPSPGWSRQQHPGLGRLQENGTITFPPKAPIHKPENRGQLTSSCTPAASTSPLIGA